MARTKGQAAMEYLMTYGWAILIVIIVVAVLFSLGVFNPATFTQTTVTGLSGFNVPAGGWQLSSGGRLVFQLTNGVGATVNITQLAVTQGATTVTNTTPGSYFGVSPDQDLEATLSPGETGTFYIPGLIGGAGGTSYAIDVVVTYDNLDSGLNSFKSAGTLTGTKT